MTPEVKKSERHQPEAGSPGARLHARVAQVFSNMKAQLSLVLHGDEVACTSVTLIGVADEYARKMHDDMIVPIALEINNHPCDPEYLVTSSIQGVEIKISVSEADAITFAGIMDNVRRKIVESLYAANNELYNRQSG